MKRFLYILSGTALLLLGAAKPIGLAYALLARSPAPAQYTAKQILYAVSLSGAGIAMVLAGLGSRTESGTAQNSENAPELSNPD